MNPLIPTRRLGLDHGSLQEAAIALRAGGLVAFPTETVYGLGADATNDEAVARIFSAKGRPHFNPLICHFPDLEAVGSYVRLDERAVALAEAFWPGALTLVLPRSDLCRVSLLCSAALSSLAVRVSVPHALRHLLAEPVKPVAAPLSTPF